MGYSVDTAQRMHKNSLFFWILIALAIRVIIMPITMHGDTIFVNYFPSKLAYNGIFSIYRYIKINFPVDTITRVYYPPLTFLITGFFQLLLKPINPGFLNWINLVYDKGIFYWYQGHGVSSELFRFLFFMKLPYLLFDIFCILLIVKFFKTDTLKMKAFKIWALNPVLLYGIYMMGQVDIFVSFFILLSVYLLMKQKVFWAFLFLGLGALCKTSPLFLIPPLMIVAIKSKRDFFKGIIALSIPALFIFLPYYISSQGYAVTSLFPRFYIQDATASIHIRKIIFFIFYILLLRRCLINRINNKNMDFISVSLATLFFLYITVFVPVHYFVWIIPIYIIAVIRKIIPLWIYNLQIVLLFLSALNSASTTSRLFMPLNPEFFYNIPGIPDLMHLFSIRWGVVMLLSRMVFVLICVLLGIKLAGIISKKGFFSYVEGGVQ